MGWIIPTALLLFAIALVIVQRRRANPKFLAHAEYWVFLPDPKMPVQADVMKRMIQDNPHGAGRIGKKEGLLFGDIRLHMGLALREKNPRLFRPDLLGEVAEPTPEILARLAEAQGMVKVRYVSETPLPDRRHLQFLLHAADAIAATGGGRVVFDPAKETLLTAEDLSALLDEHFDATVFELHVRTEWSDAVDSGTASTYGMVKVGLPELTSLPAPSDHRFLVVQLIEEAARRMWERGDVPADMVIEAFGDQFRLTFARSERDRAHVQIHRHAG